MLLMQSTGCTSRRPIVMSRTWGHKARVTSCIITSRGMRCTNRHMGNRKGFGTGTDELQMEEPPAVQASPRKPTRDIPTDVALCRTVAFAMSKAECSQNKVQKHT